MNKCILNNQIIDQNKAFIHASDLTLLRGYGIFDFLRCVGSKPLFFEDHLDRFYNSASMLRLECPVEKEELAALIRKLIDVNGIDNSGIRMVLTGGESLNAYEIGKPTLLVFNEAIKPLPEEYYTKGIKLLGQNYERDIPEVKTINYLMGIWKTPELKEAGALDLLFHSNGKISESTRSNFFVVMQDDTIVTAADGILKGINRKHILQFAKGKYAVEERDLLMEELKNVKEAFITGTTKVIVPVVQIDDITIGTGKPGAITNQLKQEYEAYIDSNLK
ncbi:MAG: aminotransferase class IV [Cyclobacteriaceae bacterium]